MKVRRDLIKIALAWLVVTLPLGWGVYQSVVKSLPLFKNTRPKQVSASTSASQALPRP